LDAIDTSFGSSPGAFQASRYRPPVDHLLVGSPLLNLNVTSASAYRTSY